LLGLLWARRDLAERGTPMPLHFEEVDVAGEVRGTGSALIVPCRVCPAVTIAVREEKPFMELWRSLLRSPPFERYLRALQARLRDTGVEAKVFSGRLHHQWFMCMWSAGTRKKLRREARQHDTVIVLGCASATVTVREAVAAGGCRVIEGMRATAIMNGRLRLTWPCNVTLRDCRETPLMQPQSCG
jgi:hypothetical protein